MINQAEAGNEEGGSIFGRVIGSLRRLIVWISTPHPHPIVKTRGGGDGGVTKSRLAVLPGIFQTHLPKVC